MRLIPAYVLEVFAKVMTIGISGKSGSRDGFINFTDRPIYRNLSANDFQAAPAAGLWMIHSGDIVWKLSPGSGARMDSWTIGGREQIYADVNTAAASDSFLKIDGKNTFHLKQQFKLVKAEIKGREFVVEFIRMLSPGDHTMLDGIQVTLFPVRRIRFQTESRAG